MSAPPLPAILATVWRGGAPEGVIRGHVAVVSGPSLKVTASAGDPACLTAMRSAIKPAQALALAERADDLGIGDDELAIACGSHDADPIHVETVRRLLGRVGLDEGVLHCGPQMPANRVETARRIVAGEPGRRIDNNCSGKHAGLIAASVSSDMSPEGYWRHEHPAQRRVMADLSRLTGCDAGTAPVGIDGCGLPTPALPLHGLARLFAAGADDELFSRCTAAMAAHPVLVAGTGRFDTLLLTAAGDKLVCKGGAMAIWVGARRDRQEAVAIKLEAGSSEHMAAIACAVLSRRDMLAHPLPGDLAALAEAPLTNRAGDVVGEVRIELPDGL